MKVHEDIYVAYIPRLAVLPSNTMTYYPKPVFFNRGSASGFQRFRRNRQNSPVRKFATTVLCGCSNTESCIIT